MSNNKININEIMKEIRQAIKIKNYNSLPVCFDDIVLKTNNLGLNFNQDSFFHDLYNINNIHNIKAYRNIKTRNGMLGKVILFIKKFLRKSIKFYIEPIVDDQNMFNASVVRSINEISNYIADETISDINLEINKLELKLSKNIKKPLNEYIKVTQEIKKQNINIVQILNKLTQDMKKQKEENTYLKDKIKLLNVNSEILKKNMELLKNKIGE